jgi:hypothetical protein
MLATENRNRKLRERVKLGIGRPECPCETTIKFQHLKISRIKSLILGDSQNSDAKKMTSRMPRRPKH